MRGDPPPEEQCGSMPWESLKFRVLKLSYVPELKKLGYRQGECKVLMETENIRDD